MIDKERKRRTLIERIYNEITLETSLTTFERSLEPKEFISWPKMSVIRGWARPLAMALNVPTIIKTTSSLSANVNSLWNATFWSSPFVVFWPLAILFVDAPSVSSLMASFIFSKNQSPLPVWSILGSNKKKKKNIPSYVNSWLHKYMSKFLVASRKFIFL